ncbi:uncharacterized protein EV420DRAFT_1639959 [Desarmillaria tabescens]|uniref:Uncharacterized protein n=1 Tax=Armillaria tabescens TaxID=1929756 RepID=A0AA39N9R8_ARMTA|nr:uncharacterized protein EV420DRAFT_1639959 [Desarmillaria tabescens]KAK0461665.1 hypothetical protein EV420DRAFT_1639959 [Desarmillaria tabescens]
MLTDRTNIPDNGYAALFTEEMLQNLDATLLFIENDTGSPTNACNTSNMQEASFMQFSTIPGSFSPTTSVNTNSIEPPSLPPHISVDSLRPLLEPMERTELNDSDLAKTTWASRNPRLPTLPIREWPTTQGSAVTGSRALLRKENEGRREEYNKQLRDAKDRVQHDIARLASTFHRDENQIQFDLVGGTLYRKPRRLCFEDVKISMEAKKHNADLPPGKRLGIKKLRAVATANTTYDNLTPEEKSEMVKAFEAEKAVKSKSVRSTSLSAGNDFRATSGHIGQELQNLAVRTGAMSFSIMTRSHLDDAFQTQVHSSLGAEEFIWDTFNMELVDMARHFEMWACSKATNHDERETTAGIRCEITAKIQTKLRSASHIRTAAMHYEKYDTHIIQAYGVELRGWPKGIPFMTPSNIKGIVDLRKLHDALDSGKCHWHELTPEELRRREEE